MSARAFLLFPSNKDVGAAQRFGKIVTVFDESDPRRVSFWSPKFADVAIERMRELAFNPETDYVIAAGNMVPVVLFFTALCDAYPNDVVRGLFFDIVRNEYVPLNIGYCNALSDSVSVQKAS